MVPHKGVGGSNPPRCAIEIKGLAEIVLGFLFFGVTSGVTKQVFVD